MPYKANEARRHKIPRARYKVANWPEYDKALQRRGSLTVWGTPEALAELVAVAGESEAACPSTPAMSGLACGPCSAGRSPGISAPFCGR